ncbi:hypothetical protein D3C80_1624520 [compost metagenome]
MLATKMRDIAPVCEIETVDIQTRLADLSSLIASVCRNGHVASCYADQSALIQNPPQSGAAAR